MRYNNIVKYFHFNLPIARSAKRSNYKTLMYYITLIQKYRETLVSKIAQMEKVLEHAPEGHLKIERRGSKYYYAVRQSNQNRRHTTYIRENSRQLRQFSNKRLAEKALPIMKKNLSAANSFLLLHSGRDATEIAEAFPPELQKLNANLVQTGAAIDQIWAEASYPANPYRNDALILETKKGFPVRSKSEMIISDLLFTRGILYRNECRLDLNDGKPPVYPDFTILHPKTKKLIYWEHFGLMDMPDYCDDACRKINRYLKAGLLPGENLFFSFETTAVPFDSDAAEHIIDAILQAKSTLLIELS